MRRFFEILIRMSQHLFMNMKARSKQFGKDGTMLPFDNYKELSPSQAWHCFIEYVLKPFVETELKQTW